MSRDFTILWLQAASCGGCTMSALGAGDRGLVAMLAQYGIRLLWHPSLSEEGGMQARAMLEAAAAGTAPFDCLCVEGAILRGPGGSGRFQILGGTGRPMAEWVRALAAKAAVTVAVGTCAAYGGIPAAGDNPTQATGLQWSGEVSGGLLGRDWRSPAGLPVINVAGCAPHPGWVIETLAALAEGALSESDLDPLGRPLFFAGRLAHHGCARNEFYEFMASAEHWSDGGCLMENLGCKATQAAGDCNLRAWNGGGSCTNAGYPCVACTSPGFEEPGAPFLETPKLAGIPVGLPLDMPKAWFMALAALSKSATPERVRRNAHADHVAVPPVWRPRKP